MIPAIKRDLAYRQIATLDTILPNEDVLERVKVFQGSIQTREPQVI